MLQSEPNDVFLLYALAMAVLSEGETAEGLNRLQDVIDRHPNYVAAYFQKGQVLAREGQHPEARDVLDEGIRVAAQVGDGHAMREMSEFLETL
jgi:tetratricopeptide (TPR) repeat protein